MGTCAQDRRGRAAYAGVVAIRPDPPQLRPWRRFVAVGDSFTEGLTDEDPARPGEYVGWADRVAGVLAARNAREGIDLRYANLAVRGRRIDAVLAEQLPAAVTLRPDLVSLSAGGNDVLRPRVSIPEVMAKLEGAVETLRGGGADVVLFTSANVSWIPVVSRITPRLVEHNAHLWAIGQRTGAFVVDLYTLRALRQPRMYAEDRIHLSAEGHRVVAVQVLWTLGLPVEEHGWLDPPAAEPADGRREALRGQREALREHRAWALEHLGPWVGRRLRGQSSGDGRTGKRPDLQPVDPAAEDLDGG